MIINPKKSYIPNDEIKGIVYIQNKGNEEEMVENVRIQLTEKFKKFKSSTRTKTKIISGEVKLVEVDDSGWDNKSNDLANYNLLEKEMIIDSNEVKKIPFKIKLPRWSPKLGGDLKDWHLLLTFKIKTKWTSSLGENPDSAKCFLPVDHTSRPPSISANKVGTAPQSLIKEDLSKIKKSQKKQLDKKVAPKLKKVLKVSDKVRLDMVKEILNIDDSLFNEMIFDWAERFNFRIDGNFLIINKDTVSEFIDLLDDKFQQWESKSTGKKKE